MNLPHLPPIRFVTHVLERTQDNVKVASHFPSLPTLSMLFEAAAQASSALSESEDTSLGFLVLCKDVTLHVSPQGLDFVISIEKHVSLGKSTEFYFIAHDKSTLMRIASGFVTIVLQD